MKARNLAMGVIGLIAASVSVAAIPVGAAPKGEAIDEKLAHHGYAQRK